MQPLSQIKFTSIGHPRVKHLFVLLFFIAVVGCESSSTTPGDLEAVDNSLTCATCEEVEVIEITDGNSLATSIGDIRLFGAYVLDQPADCADEAESRLRTLAGNTIRIENGPDDSVRQADNHYYLYTEDGRSIEQVLIDEGLALTWTQDGQHLGWLLFKDAKAKERESGCLWHDYQAFLRDEPNEFRIPGLTYPESR